MKRPVYLTLILLVLATMACSINFNIPDMNVRTGPTQTFTVKEPAPSGNDVVRVDLAMGAGKLHLTGGGSDLLSGTIRYNIDTWKPTLTHEGSNLSLRQEHLDRISVPGTNVVNDWDMKLGGTAPLDLNISAGAYEGNINLSGLHIHDLSITDGAAQNEVHFDTANPEDMGNLSYKTGASEVKLYGLANANFDEMTFESGAGSYLLDYGGTLKKDADVTIKSGVSDMTIVVPKGMAVKVIQNGALNSINVDGSWSQDGDTYETSGSGPTLTIHVDMGVGSLKLNQK